MVAIISVANIYTNIYSHGFAGDGYPGVMELEEALELAAVDWADCSSSMKRWSMRSRRRESS